MNNKKGNLSSRLFLAAAILYFISAILAFFFKETNSVVMDLCLGSALLTLSVVHARKKSDTEAENKESKEAEETEATEKTEDQ